MMRRRFFFKLTGLAAFLPGFSPIMANQTVQRIIPGGRPLIKPRALQPGDTIALIAPSSPAPAVRIDKAIENLMSMGFKVREGRSLHTAWGYLAGGDRERLADLHWAFSDPGIQGVWCVRGGYGATRLLPDIDFDLIRNNPKVFIGYSDITALHLAIQRETGLVTFHGQVAAGDFPADTARWIQAVAMDGAAQTDYPSGDEGDDEAFKPFTIRPGIARGVLTGGNLSLLAPLIGTPWAPSYRNKIVFIEDVGEQPYRLDRMLTQLIQATDLREAAGIALGIFTDCRPKGDAPSMTLQETLLDKLGTLGIPAAYGIPFGHIARQAILPYGVEAEFNAHNISLGLREAAVTR